MREMVLRAVLAVVAVLGVIAGYLTLSLAVWAAVIATELHLLLGAIVGLSGLAGSGLVMWMVIRSVEIVLRRGRDDSSAIGVAAGGTIGFLLGAFLRGAMFSASPEDGYSSASYWLIYACSFGSALAWLFIRKRGRSTVARP